jgi:DNA-directed RNA polymerase specialized sigma24 family protein
MPDEVLLGAVLRSVLEVPEGPERDRRRDGLAARVRDLLIVSLRAHGLRPEDAADWAQKKVLLVARHLEAGDAGADREEAYVWGAGRNAAADSHRQRKRRREVSITNAGGEDRPLPSLEPDSEEEAQRKQRADRLREILDEPGPPASYREILRRVYLEDVEISVIADEELARPGRGGGGTARTPKQARYAVDQRLTRARAWLKGRLSGLDTEPDGGTAR